jgi:vacuolar-type H+-ATPase subunit H
MVLALSELLDRIRPAGAPGAPTEGEHLRDAGIEEREFADLAALIRTFEDEADAILNDARTEAAQRRRRAEERVRQINTGLPDRIAIARAEVTETSHRKGDEAREHLVADAGDRITRMLATADERIPRLVDAAIDVIWSALDHASTGIDRQ